MDNFIQAKEIIIKESIRRAREFDLAHAYSDDTMFRQKIELMLKVILKDGRFVLNHEEKEEVLSEIIFDFIGLGPIEALLKDPNVTEIMVNGPNEVYVERAGQLYLSDVKFKDEAQLNYYLEKILSPVGRRVSEYEPYADARLKDGSRANIVRSPVSSVGPLLTIRKFPCLALGSEDLIKSNTINSLAGAFLEACVISRLNILISGGAGAGKTTLLNILASFVPRKERIIIIEDTRELCLKDKHMVFLTTRPANIEGKGEITVRDMVKNALHMRPDRIIIGEVRSDEALDMIQAMNTGHDGSMTTLHANSPIEALDRLEILTLMGMANMSSEVAKRQIINAVDLMVHMSRFPDGSRKVISVVEMLKDREYSTREILSFDDSAGELKFTGSIPAFSQKINKESGYVFSAI
jgi:pilus assembly protein CpaF